MTRNVIGGLSDDTIRTHSLEAAREVRTIRRVMFAASIPYLESYLGERFTYTQAMGGLVTAVFIIAFIVTAVGPEAKGVSFRRAQG